MTVRDLLRSRIADVLLAVLTLVTLAGATRVLLDHPSADAGTRRVTALFVGGWVTGGGASSPAAVAAAGLGWRASFVDHPGGSLLLPANDGAAPLARQITADLGVGQYDAVIVSAGVADLGASPASVALATAHLVDRLRAKLKPRTTLVLLAPPSPSALSRPVVAALAEVCSDKSVHFLAPAGAEVASRTVADTAGARTLPTPSVDPVAGVSSYLAALQVSAD